MLGGPFIPLLDLIGQCPTLRRCVGLAVHAQAQVGTGGQTLLPMGGHLHHWGLGFRQCSFHHNGRVERDQSYSVFGPSRLVPACSGPVDLSVAGKLVAQAPPSSASRLRRGCNDAPHGAHRTCDFHHIRLKQTTTHHSNNCSPAASVVCASLLRCICWWQNRCTSVQFSSMSFPSFRFGSM